MKKFISLCLAVSISFSVGAFLAACGGGHEHNFKGEWVKDATYHWHECEEESCPDIFGKAEHIWNDGEVTSEATFETNGEKTYTCSVCGQTKIEPIEYGAAAPSQLEWDQSFEKILNADNITIVWKQFVDGVSDGNSTAYIDGNKIFITGSHPYNEVNSCYSVIDSDGKVSHYTASSDNFWSIEQADSVHAMPPYESVLNQFKDLYLSFAFDSQTGLMTANSITVMGLTMDVNVKIENGLITFLEYNIEKNPSVDMDANCKISFDFSDCGATKVTLPVIDE